MNDGDGPATDEVDVGDGTADSGRAETDPTGTPATDDAGAGDDPTTDGTAGSGPEGDDDSGPEAATASPDSESGGGTGAATGYGTTKADGLSAGVAGTDGELDAFDPSDVDVEALTGPPRELNPRVRLVWVLRAGLASLVLGGLAGAAGVLTPLPTWVGPAVFTVAFALGVALALARYRSWSYRVREDSLFLDRGVVTRVQTVVPYVRIQHVDASRGPVERLFGLATVVVYTAGSRGADVSIPGLTPERAEDLQDRLKRLAIAAEGEDAV